MSNSRQFRLPIFLRNLHIGGIILAVSVFLHGSEHIPDNTVLPWLQIKGLSPPPAFGVFQAVNKIHRSLCPHLVKHYPQIFQFAKTHQVVKIPFRKTDATFGILPLTSNDNPILYVQQFFKSRTQFSSLSISESSLLNTRKAALQMQSGFPCIFFRLIPTPV